MTPAEAVPESAEKSAWPRLRGRRILVADTDESVRVAAHNLLERFGCIVETAHTGVEATLMVRNSVPDATYDVIIADVRLPDFSRLRSANQAAGYSLARTIGTDEWV